MRYLYDSKGRGLTKDDVKFLAACNIIASNELENVDKLREVDLLQWATDVDGSFNDDQVHGRGLRFKNEFFVGDFVSPKDFRTFSMGMCMSPDIAYEACGFDNGRVEIKLRKNVSVYLQPCDLTLVAAVNLP